MKAYSKQTECLVEHWVNVGCWISMMAWWWSKISHLVEIKLKNWAIAYEWSSDERTVKIGGPFVRIKKSHNGSFWDYIHQIPLFTGNPSKSFRIYTEFAFYLIFEFETNAWSRNLFDSIEALLWIDFFMNTLMGNGAVAWLKTKNLVLLLKFFHMDLCNDALILGTKMLNAFPWI